MSWLKFETDTHEKPEVLAITVEMGWDDPDLTVGKLLRVWRWFDQHTVEGNAPSVTLSLLDRLIGVTGFSQAMVNAGWLISNQNGLSLPNFERHNGKTAKDRALNAKRAANFKSNAASNAESNAPSVTQPLPNALPRERKEKKRKELTTTTKNSQPDKPSDVSDSVWSDFLQIRKSKRSPLTATALSGIQAEADKACISLQTALEHCCARGWQGFQAEWLNKLQPMPIGETIYQRSIRERVAEIAPGVARKAPVKFNPNFIDEVRDVITIESR